MKASAILLILSLCCSITMMAQTQNWFVLLTPVYGIGGPGGGIVSNVNEYGFNRPETNLLAELLNLGSTDYPKSYHTPSGLITFGKRIRPNGSLYLMLGETLNGSVTGFNGQAFAYINYHILQCTAGYQFSFPKTHFKVGLGPSLFLFKYSEGHNSFSPDESASVIKPGISVMARVPLGAEKKIFGIELFFEANFTSGTTMNALPETAGQNLPAANVSLVHAAIGISFAFRH